MLEDCVDGHLVPVDDIEHTFREAGLRQELGRQHRSGRILLRRLQHEGVPARDGDRIHPHGHHRREVERGDPGHDPERLPDGVGVDPCRYLFGVVALEQVGDVARELDHLETALDLTERVVERLAVLTRESTCQIDLVLHHQLTEREHDVLASRQGREPPRIERLAGHRHGLVHVVPSCERDLGRLLTRRRVVDRPGPLRLVIPRFATDPVVDECHRFTPSSSLERSTD